MNTEEHYFIQVKYIHIYFHNINRFTLLSLHPLLNKNDIFFKQTSRVIAQNHKNCLFPIHLKSLAVFLSFSVGLAPHDGDCGYVLRGDSRYVCAAEGRELSPAHCAGCGGGGGAAGQRERGTGPGGRAPT